MVFSGLRDESLLLMIPLGNDNQPRLRITKQNVSGTKGTTAGRSVGKVCWVWGMIFWLQFVGDLHLVYLHSIRSRSLGFEILFVDLLRCSRCLSIKPLHEYSVRSTPIPLASAEYDPWQGHRIRASVLLQASFVLMFPAEQILV